jgi:hypothetical protein
VIPRQLCAPWPEVGTDAEFRRKSLEWVHYWSGLQFTRICRRRLSDDEVSAAQSAMRRAGIPFRETL